MDEQANDIEELTLTELIAKSRVMYAFLPDEDDRTVNQYTADEVEAAGYRKVVDAPSDTDAEAPLRAVIAEALALHERGETTYAPGEGMVTTEDDHIPDGCLYCRVPWPCQHVTILSRTPEVDNSIIEEEAAKAREWLSRTRTPQPSTVTEALTDAEWREFQSIPDQGYSHRAWVDHKIAQRVDAARLTPAQPEQVTEWEYARANSWGYVTEPEDDLADARRRAAGYPAGYKGGYQSVVRRRKAGPWEPVTPESGEKR